MFTLATKHDTYSIAVYSFYKHSYYTKFVEKEIANSLAIV